MSTADDSPASKRRAAGANAGRTVGPANGALLLIGGGRFGPEIRQEMVRLGTDPAGRSEWVFITTAESDEVVPTRRPFSFIAGEGAVVTTLHTRDRAEADTEAFVAPLRRATAVFLFGGRHFRLVDAYAGTRVERELRGVLDRGGLIAGTSAGATIVGSYLVRGHPSEDNTILMAPGYEDGFCFISNATIDQHISARQREADLAKVVAVHPGLLGIGIDEDTCVTIRQNELRVIGPGLVFITDGAMHDGKPYYTIPAGTVFDLASRKARS
jgi:cyanophycinase